MEALAATATVVQISIYASNVTSALQELRQTIRHGSAKLRGQSQRLDVLEVVVKKIEQDPRLQSQQVAGYLATVRDDILRLHGLVLNNIQSPRDTFLRKVGAGIALLKADKRIETAFANLEKDCGVITLYMSRYESSPTMAENQQQQTMQFNQRGELVSTDSHEMRMVPYQPSTQRSGPGVSPGNSGPGQAQGHGTSGVSSSASTAPDLTDQLFEDICATGTAIDGAGSNNLGNLKVAALQGKPMKQVFKSVRAQPGGHNVLGNVD